MQHAMTTIRGITTLALTALGISYPVPARADTFTVTPGGESKVVFTSKAPLETFQGKTKSLRGTFSLDPAALGDSLTIHMEVDLATLDTGIDKRNRHMRENHLETAKYPRAVFDGASVLPSGGRSLAEGKPQSVDIEGTFSLHGVSRRLRVSVVVTRAGTGAKGRIAFATRFPVALSDYKIPRPEFLFMKLGEVQQVAVSGVAVAAP